MKISTYLSDGSDGYSPGTYGCLVMGTDGLVIWADGGWSSRSKAHARGIKAAKALAQGLS